MFAGIRARWFGNREPVASAKEASIRELLEECPIYDLRLHPPRRKKQVLGLTYIDLPIPSCRPLQRVLHKPKIGEYSVDEFGLMRFSKRDVGRTVQVQYLVENSVFDQAFTIGECRL